MKEKDLLQDEWERITGEEGCPISELYCYSKCENIIYIIYYDNLPYEDQYELEEQLVAEYFKLDEQVEEPLEEYIKEIYIPFIKRLRLAFFLIKLHLDHGKRLRFKDIMYFLRIGKINIIVKGLENEE